MCGIASFKFYSTKLVAGEIASEGHTDAQVPQSMQVLGSIT